MSTMTLPSVDNQKQRPQRQQPKQEAVIPEVDPSVPIGYVRRRVDVKMIHRHAMILHDKLRKLQDSGARLEDGTEVSDHTKAVLWILENEVT